MTGVKIVDKDTRAPCRRPRLWECFGEIGVNPSDIKDAPSAYYAILPADKVEFVLTDVAKNVFQKEGFEILPPIEYSAMRSVVVRHIDKVTHEYSNEKIIQSIQ